MIDLTKINQLRINDNSSNSWPIPPTSRPGANTTPDADPQYNEDGEELFANGLTLEQHANDLTCPNCGETIDVLYGTETHYVDVTYRLRHGQFEEDDYQVTESDNRELEYKCRHCDHDFEDEIIEAIDDIS